MNRKRDLDLGVLLVVLAAGGVLACPGLERDPLTRQVDEVPPDAGAADASPVGSDAAPPQTTSGLCGIIGAGRVRAIVPLPGGSSFAVGYSTGKIAFYAVGQTTTVTRTINAHTAAIKQLRVSADGTLLGSAAENGELKLWGVADGKTRRVVIGPGPEISAFAFSPDAATLAVLRYDQVELQDTASGTLLWRQLDLRYGGTLFFSADGQTLIHGGDSLAFRNAVSGELLRVLTDEFYGIRGVSADATTLLSFRSRTSSVRAVRLSDGKPLWTIELPEPMNVEAAAFSRDGTAVTAVTTEGKAMILDATDGHLIRALSLEDGSGGAVSYSSDDQLLAVGLTQGALRVWHLATGELKLKEPIVPGHIGPITKAAFSADGELVGSISGGLQSRDRALKVWRTSDGALLHSTARDVEDGTRKSFAFSPDSAVVAMGGSFMAKQIYLLRASDGTQLRTIDAADATDLAFSPDGTLLAASAYCIDCLPQAVGIWRVADGAPVPGFGQPDLHGGGAVLFSPDGTLLAATAPGNRRPSPASVAVWKVADRSLLWSVPGPVMPALGGEPDSAAFSPDGSLLALGSSGAAAVRVFHAQDGAPVGDLAATAVRSVAFSPSGAVLAAAGEDGLRLWRLSDWSLFGEIPGQFTAVTFSPDGHTLLVAARDGVMRLFCSISQPLP